MSMESSLTPEAIERATWLRNHPRAGRYMSYNVIAFIMGEYHGVWLSASTWQHELQGRVPGRPRGVAFMRREASGLRQYLAGAIDGPGGVS